MNNVRTTILALLIMGLMIFVTSSKTIARQEVQQKDIPITYIKMYVDGLACPFCAYGLEKKIKKIDGAKNMFIEINEGYITFNVPTSKIPSEEALQKLVKEAGFTARDIAYSETPFSRDEK